MSRLLPILLCTFLLSAFSISAVAQQQGQEQTEGLLLPDIDPQDIEIRSQFKARFPGLRRQPILGFDPNPRVYQIDPNRQPFMESQEEVVAYLPVSELSRPAAPHYESLFYSPEIQAFSRLGIGSYLSPVAQFWGAYELNKKSYIGGNIDFSSSDGHLDNQASSYRFFDINGDFATNLGGDKQLHVTVGGQSDLNHLYTNPLVAQTPDKKYGGLNVSADLQQFKNSIEGWSAETGIRYFNTELNAGTLSGSRNETLFKGAFTREWAGKNINETFTANAGIRGGIFESGQNTESWTTMRTGGEYHRLFNYTTDVTGRVNVYYLSNPTESRIYIGPSLRLEHSINNDLTVMAWGEARPYFKTIEQHHEANRFLNIDNQFVHTSSIDVSARAEYKYFRGSTVHAGASYNSISNHPYYFRKMVLRGQTTEDHFYALSFMDATNFKFFAGASHQLKPEKFWLSGQVYIQNPKLESGSSIPFQESWGLNASASARFFDDLLVEGWADYVGSREVFRNDNELDGFLLVGGKAEINFTDRFGAFIKIVNILDEQYQVWEGYTERGFQAYGGLTVKLQ